MFRIRNANLAKRGIDGNDSEQQVKALEERGKVLLKEYMDKKGEDRQAIPRQECEAILEPLKGAFQLMENAIKMSGTTLYYIGI